MLEVTKLTKEFISGDTKVQALNEITFSIPAGAFGAIVGKSGSGKSTLLTLLGALDKPTSGSIVIDGQDITKLSDAKLVSYRCKAIGFIFQSYNLIPNITAIENVMLPMEFAHVSFIERKKRAVKLLLDVGLAPDKQKRKPARLSGGEQQRVSIARALANKPGIILADEPTGNLDSHTSKMIIDLLKSISKSEKTTIVVVTHDLYISQHADFTFQLKDGTLVYSGKGKAVKLVS